jgi:hypothetical protein
MEEERMFSATGMNYIKNFLRNRLAEQHLNVPAVPLHLCFPYAGAAALLRGAASKRAWLAGG